MENAAKVIAQKIKSLSYAFKLEEDVRVNCESILIQEMHIIGIPYKPFYEVQISSGAIDALFNCLAIEYKAPGELATRFDFHVNEKKKYIPSLAQKYQVPKSHIAMVLLDGSQIGFFRETEEDQIVKEGPFSIDENSIQKLINLAYSTQKKALISENLLFEFGSNSKNTKDLIISLWYSLKNRHDQRTSMFIKEWSRLFGQVSGLDDGNATIVDEAKKYGIELLKEECPSFVFVLHTIYAIYIKHIAILILQSKRNGRYLLPEAMLTTSLLEESKQIENGTMFLDLGISNYMEGDFFCWYILEWNSQIEKAIFNVIQILDTFEPSTGSLKPEVVKDLLKELYQGLLSKQIRHNLGEYYTPDWLAEYTIEKSGYTVGDRILDPSCGSGTFLVILINKTIQELKNRYSPKDLLNHITSHIYGFDLNPLAVIAARTNYIIALEPLLTDITEIEIPIFLSDAIFSPQKREGLYKYHIDTEDGRILLTLPNQIFERQLLSSTLKLIEQLVNYSTITGGNTITLEQAHSSLTTWLASQIDSSGVKYVIDLFDTIRGLEIKNWDGIWCRIIKNHFSSAVLKDFDIIIGNPPWLKWSSLPTAYRETIKDFCVKYGLFSSDKFYGGVESDISTMVLYSAVEKWLKTEGKLAMLITRSVFKTESSEGFRMFRLPDDSHTNFQVFGVEDFTLLKPFDDAVNKPSLIILKKGQEQTLYPVPWIRWNKKVKKQISVGDSLQKVFDNTIRTSLVARPINTIGSPWITTTPEHYETCSSLIQIDETLKYYQARKGICTDCNGVFFGRIYEMDASYVHFKNMPSLGKNKKIRQYEILLEKKLVYPIARGREIKAFFWEHSGTFGVLPQKSMHGFSEEIMLSEYPKTFSYLARHKDLLENRSSLKRYLPKDPFYSCWNVGEYTFSPYKVCWAEISKAFNVCIISSLEDKIVVPDHKIYFIPLFSKEEAYYLCSYLNAPTVEELVLAYVENTQIGTHITDYIKIPKFDPANPIHMKMVNNSRQVLEKEISIDAGRRNADSLLLLMNI